MHSSRMHTTRYRAATHSVRSGRRSTDWTIPAQPPLTVWDQADALPTELYRLSHHSQCEIRQTLYRLSYAGSAQELNSLRYVFLLAATKLGQGNVFTGICDSVNGGVSASVHAGIPPPPGSRHPPRSRPPGADTPLGGDTPLEQTTPGSRHPSWEENPPWEQTPLGSRPPSLADPPGDTVNARAVRILLECNLVLFCFFVVRECKSSMKFLWW